MTGSGGERRGLLALGLTLALAAAVYSSSFANGFLAWDDPVNVTQNTAIRAITWANVKTYFTEPLLGMYSPLVYLSYAADYAIGGLNPGVYHATNLLLHLICVTLVWRVGIALGGSPAAAAAASALFAVHPANVAAVTPISVRSSLLYAAFYLAAYVAYLGHAARPHGGRLALAFALFVMSGLSKSAAAVFPVLLLLTDAYRGRPFTRSVLLEKAPFFGVAVALGVVTLAVRSDVAAGDPLQTTVVERVSLAAHQLVFYAMKAAAPVNLSAFYPYPARTDGALPFAVTIAPVLVAAAAGAIFLARGSRRAWWFAAAFFVLHLALVLKVVPLGEEFTAERYLYLPLAGVCAVLAAAAARWPSRARRGALVLALAAVAVWSVVAYGRSAAWRDDMTFFGRIIERQPAAAMAYAGRSGARLASGDIDGALRDSTEAIRLDPRNAPAYFNRATAAMLAGRPGEAVVDATRAIELDARLPAYFELRAQARLNTRDFQGARDDATAAIGLAPEADEVFKSHVTRGLARMMLGDGPGALEDLNRAVALRPQESGIYQNRGQVRVALGDVAGGCADLREAVARGREDARALVADLCRQ